MRILGFSKKWDKLQQDVFTTFRFTRKDKDWQVGETVQIVYKPRELELSLGGEREALGIAEIIGKERRDLFRVGVTKLEAIQDGFESFVKMGEWLDKAYGRRWLDEPMNKLTLKWRN